jgi:L-alanine-DL-glutamate epimerase-like enolase superfamily enzyme
MGEGHTHCGRYRGALTIDAIIFNPDCGENMICRDDRLVRINTVRIEKIEAIPFRIPLKTASHWGAHGRRTAQEHVLVRIYTDKGAVGMAEAPACINIYGETQRSIVHIIRDHYAPMLIGRSVFDREGYQAAFAAIPWNPTARGALDIALHDAAAQECGIGFTEFLGGAPRPVEVSYMLSLSSGDAFIDEAMRIRAETGIRAFKIKAGANPELDIEHVRLLREALGAEGFIFIDANQLYTPQVAIRTINRMAEYGLAMAEEPVPVTLGAQRKKVADAVAVPILGDDSVITLTDVRRELEQAAIGVVGIKTSRTGIYDSVRILHLAEAHGLPCWIGSQGVSGVGARARPHVAAAFRNIPFPADITASLRQEDDLLDFPLSIRDGKLQLPAGPGIGVRIDEAKLKRYRLDW